MTLCYEGYHRFETEDGEFYGSFEVFEEGADGGHFFWWPCFPGCLPDGDAHGPFKTAQEAYDDAKENN